LEFTPNLKLVLLPNFINGPLRLVAGWRFVMPLKYDFVQSERILSPADLYFILADSSFVRERKLASGSIGNISKLGIGMNLGLENLLRLSNRLYWTQQIGVDLSANITTDANWKPHSFNVSTGLRYSFHKKEPIEIPLEEKIIKIEIPSEPLIAIAPVLEIEPLGFAGIIETGTELLATAPIVNAVFFDNNSSELPQYLKFDQLSREDKYKMHPKKLHSYILVKIADILKNNPNATVSLIGATAGRAFESKGLALADERAKTIKNEFIKLGIDEKRIKTFAKLLPDFPSNNRFEDGVKENQRVDIILNNAQLQEYVNFLVFTRVKGEQSYKIKIENAAQKFSLSSSLADSTVEVSDNDSVYIFNINKQIANDENGFLENQIKLYSSSLNRKIIDSIDLQKLERRTVATDYSKFLAILRFDFNSSALSKTNQELLRQLVTFLPENCTLEILGSADLMGSAARNTELTRKRANAAMTFLNSLTRGKINFELGGNYEKFDESTPQGRMLNRSIFIRIKQ
jgi:outer membrane protein OmpA-like peptidoglycan-associated protein